MVIIIFGVYFQTLSYGVTGFDDDKILQNVNSFVKNNSISDIFKTDAFLTFNGSEFFRPVQGLSFIIDTKAGDNNIFYFHLTNLLLHIINCCLVFYLLLLFNCDKRISFFLTMIFSVHPLFNQAVIWLPSRGDLLVTVFSLISFISYVKYEKSKNLVFLLINIPSFFLAVFSKEVAVLLPLIFLLYFYFKNKNTYKLFNVNNIIMTVIWVVIIIIYVIMRSNIVRGLLSSDEFGIKPILHNLPVFPEFISKFFLPINLSVLPEFSIISIIIGMIIILAGIYLIVKNKNTFSNFSIFFTAWFLLFTVTTLLYRHWHLNSAYDYLEHRAYLPLMGIILLIASIKISQKILKINIILYILIFLIFSGISVTRAGIFKNSESFYTSAINKGTKISFAYNNRGIIRRNANDNKGALEDFDKAIQLKPDFVEVYNNRALSRYIQGNTNLAIQDYNKAIELKPDYAEAYRNRGIVRRISNDNKRAVDDFTKAIELVPGDFLAYHNRGLSKSDLGDIERARKDFDKAISLNPEYIEAYFNRGKLLVTINNLNAALNDFKKAVELKPDYELAMNAAGTVNGMLGNHKEAAQYFEKTIRINSNFADAWRNLGFAKQNLNDLKGACEAWQKGAGLGNNQCKELVDKFCK